MLLFSKGFPHGNQAQQRLYAIGPIVSHGTLPWSPIDDLFTTNIDNKAATCISPCSPSAMLAKSFPHGPVSCNFLYLDPALRVLSELLALILSWQAMRPSPTRPTCSYNGCPPQAFQRHIPWASFHGLRTSRSFVGSGLTFVS